MRPSRPLRLRAARFAGPMVLLLVALGGCAGGPAFSPRSRGHGWYVPPDGSAGTRVRIRIVNESNVPIAGTTGSGSPFSVAPGAVGFVEDFYAEPPCHAELHFAEGGVCACPWPFATFRVAAPGHCACEP